MADIKKVKTLTGEIINNSTDKTVTVLLSRIKSHRIYKKNYIVNKKIQAHDQGNLYKIGDIVEISPSRPLSKTKKYIVTKKVK